MRKVSIVIIVLLGITCLFSCERGGKDELSRSLYDGYYGSCEYLSLDFKSNSKVRGHLCSTDFVGNFSDDIYGHYEYKHPYITIVWERASWANLVYKSMYNPDSILINESLDTLLYFEQDQCYTLSKYHKWYQVDRDAPITKKISDFCLQALIYVLGSLFRYFIFLLSLIDKYLIYIVLFAVVLFFGIKWRKKRLQNK